MAAYVVGVSMSAFGRWPDRTYEDLAREVVDGALSDAGIEGTAVDAVVFGSCAAGEWGQASIRGQVILEGLREDGSLPARVPVANVDAACATGILAFQTAADRIAGGAGLVLAVGVDKTFLADPRRIGPLFEGALNGMDREGRDAFYAGAADRAGQDFAPHPHRSVLMDIAAVKASAYLERHGVSLEQLASVAVKSRRHAVANDRAQARTAMTRDQVLADKPVVGPFTRAMCTPLADGAAAVLLASEEALGRHPGLAERAVRIAGSGFAGGRKGALGEPSETVDAGRKAFEEAGLEPKDVHVAEVHDATSFAELLAVEELGFCGPGEGASWTEAGRTTYGGDVVVNPSGGLTSRGHPLAATGLAMVHEITVQLRREAGERQVPDAAVGLVHNAGGLIGFDEALAGVVLLRRL